MIKMDIGDLINQKDPLQVVIRVHLEIESWLMRFLEIEIFNFESADFSNFSFMDKVNLAFGLALISKQDKDILINLNRMRNSFAHNIHSKITKKEIQDLWSCLKKEEMDLLNKVNYPKKSLLGKLGGIMFILECRFKQYEEYHIERRRDELERMKDSPFIATK